VRRRAGDPATGDVELLADHGGGSRIALSGSWPVDSRSTGLTVGGSRSRPLARPTRTAPHRQCAESAKRTTSDEERIAAGFAAMRSASVRTDGSSPVTRNQIAELTSPVLTTISV
jgi:hypothetical protein